MEDKIAGLSMSLVSAGSLDHFELYKEYRQTLNLWPPEKKRKGLDSFRMMLQEYSSFRLVLAMLRAQTLADEVDLEGKIVINQLGVEIGDIISERNEEVSAPSFKVEEEKNFTGSEFENVINLFSKKRSELD